MDRVIRVTLMHTGPIVNRLKEIPLQDNALLIDS